MFNRRVFSRRSLLTGTTASFAAAGLGTLDDTFTTFDSKKSQTTNDGCDGEVLGQDPFRYRAHRHWGVLDRTHYPVKDCHGICVRVEESTTGCRCSLALSAVSSFVRV